MFLQKIKSKESTIGIIGMGYVGLPLAIAFAKKGVKIIGFDIDASKVEALNQGTSYLNHISSEQLSEHVSKGLISASSDFSRLTEVDCILICVPTPLSKHREPDLTAVLETGKEIAKHLRKGQLVVLESSTYPGTTSEELADVLKVSGLEVDKDFYLAYSPEREDPGNKDFLTSDISKVVGADSDEGLELATALYEHIVPTVVQVSSTKTAEAVKLTENIFRSVNIAMVNELKLIYEEMGIDVWEVIDAAASKPFGYMPFYPGPGLGGHCIPIDPFYLTFKAREFDVPTRFIELAGEINTSMPKIVVSACARALSSHSEKSVKNSHILVVGLAYKSDIDDMRESPALVLMELLEGRGAIVDYYDDFIPVIPETREHAKLAGRKSIDFNKDSVEGYDLVLISTKHSKVDFQLLADHASIIVDTRNAMSGLSGKAKVIKA
jgi:UDP-N-acetyl-D-glucosamine dehydrogenase